MRRALALLAVALAAAGACRHPPRPETQKPLVPRAGNGLDVLLITIDALRADHLGLYGYRRRTSPHLDALAARSMMFDAAYTFWPKTRGSFVMMMTGRRASQNGYSRRQPELLGFNPTLAATLQDAGYETAAVVDNPNLAAQHGYAKGFARYRETWTERALATEVDRSRAITDDALSVLAHPPADRPLFLWLHYVSPHAPYTPPPPYDTAFLDADAARGPVLKAVASFHGGVSRQWAVPGKRLGYYVAQYDGEIAAADAEVGRVLDALEKSPRRDRTVVVLTADHGESLGEHDYYFDHGEDLFDPCLRVPLLVHLPGARAGRSAELASTLDVLPTILDAVKVSYPPDLSGHSLLPLVSGSATARGPARLFAENDRNLSATFDARFKMVAPPADEGGRNAFFDRGVDPGETQEASGSRPQDARAARRELELYFERRDREWAATQRLTEKEPAPARIDCDTCARLESLGYLGTVGCETCRSKP